MIETPEPIVQNKPEKFDDLTSNYRRSYIAIGGTLFAGLFCLVLFFAHLISPPIEFPTDSSISIGRGMSVADIVEKFEEEGYVRSSTMLLLYLRVFYDNENIKAGIYNFTEPLSTQAVAHTISEIGPDDPLISITFPEGSTVSQIAAIADEHLEEFDLNTFLSYAKDYEGYLFPETYFVPDNYTDALLFDLMKDAATTELSTLSLQIDAHPLTEYEILILASIIEREANTPESMRYVSSILQNRMEIGMPLQADATIEYTLDTPLGELAPGQLAQELRRTDSPYNTYLNTGLPPTPIGNPGIDSITAVLEPADTDYFYYITGNDGEFYYAKTLDEHNYNIARYLR